MTVYHLPVRGSSFGTTADSQSSFRGVLKSLPGVFFVALLFMVLPAQRAAAATGGPDAAGYRFVDSAEAGLSYSFQNIVGAGGILAATASSNDDTSENVPIGFAFSYYGNSYTTVDIGSNGFLIFGGGNGITSGTVPSVAVPNNLIAGWWQDLDPSAAGAGDIYYQTLGSAPNRVLIAQFQGVQEYGTPGNLNTFEFKLFEGSNRIEIHYQGISNGSGNAAIGIENSDGTVGLSLLLWNGGATHRRGFLRGAVQPAHHGHEHQPQRRRVAAAGHHGCFSRWGDLLRSGVEWRDDHAGQFTIGGQGRGD
jgi:hypothetical protein